MAQRTIRINKSYKTIRTDHDDRVTTWLDTQDYYKDSNKYSSQLYENVTSTNTKAHLEPTTLKVVEQDCIYAALEAPSGRTCILNMADWTHAGGAVDAGSRAQEEELFRRSNLHMHLHQSYYPLRLLQTVYSTDVEFFKNGFDNGFARMAEPQKFDVISAPALCGPETTDDGKHYVHPEDVEIMRTKIRNLILIAAERDVDTLILSAWGCGAFGCPPTHTAQIFKEVIQEYDGLIPNITFAILGLNYYPFAAILTKKN